MSHFPSRRKLVEAAEEEDRIILTRDRAMVLARFSDAVYFVKTDNKRSQLLEIIHEFKLEIPGSDLLSRCGETAAEWSALACVLRTPIDAFDR